MNTIRAGLLRWARRIGTWLIRRLAKWVGKRLISYMQHRVDDWLLREHPPLGRVRRWRLAIAWLQDKIDDIAACAKSEFELLADHAEKKLGLPVVARESEAA
jgi:hypothetical protein